MKLFSEGCVFCQKITLAWHCKHEGLIANKAKYGGGDGVQN